MQCYIHNNKEAMAVCTSCGKFICEECNVTVGEKSVCKGCIQNTNSLPNNQSELVVKKNVFILFLLIFFLPIGFNYLYLGLKKRAMFFLKFSIIIYFLNIILYITHVPVLIFSIIIFKDSLDIRSKMKLGIKIEDNIQDLMHFCKPYKELIISIIASIVIINMHHSSLLWITGFYSNFLMVLLSIYIYIASTYIMIKFILKPSNIFNINYNNNKDDIKEETKGGFQHKESYTDELIRTGKDLAFQLTEKSYSLINTNIGEDVEEIAIITNKIFDFINKYPHKAKKLNKFIDYYLPTTLKLLHNYEYLKSQDLGGKNIEDSSQNIEVIIKTILGAFKNQIDTLFADKALDIDAEISVLSDILKKEGLFLI